MITLFTGRPRSGKSYRVVYSLLRVEIQSKYFIVHEIKGLRRDAFDVPAHVRSVDEVCEAYGITRKEFFTDRFQADLGATVREKYNKHVLVVIDECYKYMGVVKTDLADRAEIMAWLAQHGHYGQDVWLICQSPDQLYGPLESLVAERIHAKKGVLCNRFIYSHYSGKASYRTSFLPKRKAVFGAYKSFDVQDTAPRPSKLIPIILIVCCGCLVWFVMYMRNPFGWGRDSSSPGSAQTVQAATATPSPPGRTEPKRAGITVPHLDVAQYSYAGLLGGKVMLQRTEGGSLIQLADLLPGHRVLDAQRAEATVQYRGEIIQLSRRPIIIKRERATSEGSEGAAEPTTTASM